MNALVQAGRIARFETNLGADTLALLRFEADEALSGLFSYTVETLAERDDIEFDDLVGTHGTVFVESANGTVPFDGIITEARWRGSSENGWRYDLTMRPWLFLAGKRRNQRIFHNRTVAQILAELFADYSSLGDPHFEDRLSKSYPVLEYTVQYRESDLDFARRLMERFGISFHFAHLDGCHTLVLTDDIASHDHLGARPYFGVDRSHKTDAEHFWLWEPEKRLTTGAVRLIDYNFKTPKSAMEVEHVGDAEHPHAQIESFDYPGDYLDQGRGKEVVALRTGQERGAGARLRAKGDIVELTPGGVFRLDGGDNAPGMDEDFVCLATRLRFTSLAYGSGDSGNDDIPYEVSYDLMPTTAPLAVPARTARPVVQGPQTATVVGEGEIDCDEFGRILVRFTWDLAAAHSMRCRVSQSWASKGWGGMVIPRIGMEVVVEFLEGDPDKPLVTGAVYNGKNGAPYPLPDHKTRSVFRSDTHMADGFNEITFEDKAGEENLSLHAQKDMTDLVLNDRIARIGRHHVSSVGENHIVEVGANQKSEVAGSVTTVVGGAGGGALGLLSGLAGLAGKSGSLLRKAGQEAGNSDPALGSFASSIAGTALGFLSAKGLSARSGVVGSSGAGDKDANDKLRQSGSALGESGGGLFSFPGVMNTLVSNFRSDTTGVASVEQIGVSKVVNVGASSSEQVGKVKSVTIGEKLKTAVGKLILTRTKKHVLIATEKFTISGPGGSIEIDASGITLKAKRLVIKSPSVDFQSGMTAQSEALAGEDAFSEKCQGSAKG